MATSVNFTNTLIVDDEAHMRTLMSAVIRLENQGLRVIDVAVDGADAVDRWRALRDTDPAHVVVMDYRMPGMSGLEAAEQILAEDPDQVVILCSAFLDDAVRTQAEKIGVTACLDKSEVTTLAKRIQSLTS